MNTADSSAVLDGKSHVALLAPAGAPRILHDPVFLAIFRAVANQQGGVVKGSSALGRVKDSAGVLLEDCLVSLERDRDWLFLKSTLH